MNSYQGRGSAPFFQYDGKVGELYRIFLLNLLLSVITLGIWRFWAVTRMRRYVWSRTAHDGERFEYDGTGGQLFVGALLALGILFGLSIGAILLGVLLAMIAKPLAYLPIIALYIAIAILALGARFSAQRYRLNHTLWRGIRGGMEGSMLRYGGWALLYFLAAVFSFYQLVPCASLRLFERRANASFLGSQRASSHSKAMPLYLAWLGTFVAFLVLLLVVAGVFYSVEAMAIQLMLATQDKMMINAAMTMMLPGIIVAYAVIIIGGALISCAYHARYLRHIAGHTTLGGVSFSSNASGGQVLGLVFGNMLITIFTLGFGLPIVIQRNQNFLANHLLADGALDLASLRQTAQTPSRYGEGMFQVLDAGAGIT